MNGWDGSLTQNAVEKMSQGDTSIQPLLQVTDMRKVPNQSGTERWKMQVSDGTHFFASMLATQLNGIIHSNELQNLCIVQLKEFIANTVSGRRVLVILNLEVASGPQAYKIGSPIDINASSKPQKAASSAPDAKPFNGAYTTPEKTAARETKSNDSSMGFGKRPQPNATSGYTPFRGEPWKPGGSNAIAKVGQNATGLSGTLNFFPIMSINPYQNRWVIRGRITNKGNIRKYQNAKGEGQVFSFEISDDSGSIKVACFKELATRMYQVIEMGRTYSITKGSLKQADARFNRCTSEYELMLNNDSEVEPMEDDGSIAQIKYNFVKIGDLSKLASGSFLDLIGIVKEVSEVMELTSRSTGDLLQKRTVTLVDDSEKSIGLTLWGETANNLVTSDAGNPVLLCKGVRRGDYQGLSLDGLRSSFFELNPQLDAAFALKGWYEASGKGANVTSLSGLGGGPSNDEERRPISEFSDPKRLDLESDSRGVLFTTRVAVMMFKQDRDLWYPACPETNKKLVPIAGGRWRNEASGKEYDEPNYRYVLSVNVHDASGSLWVNIFDESARSILKTSADQMSQWRDSGDDRYFRAMDEPLFRTFITRVRAKEEVWQDEKRIKYQVLRATEADFAVESRLILDEIKSYQL